MTIGCGGRGDFAGEYRLQVYGSQSNEDGWRQLDYGEAIESGLGSGMLQI